MGDIKAPTREHGEILGRCRAIYNKTKSNLVGHTVSPNLQHEALFRVGVLFTSFPHLNKKLRYWYQRAGTDLRNMYHEGFPYFGRVYMTGISSTLLACMVHTLHDGTLPVCRELRVLFRFAVQNMFSDH